TSIGGVDDPLVVIAGGDGKGAEFGALADALRGRRCAVVVLGRDAGRIAAVLDGICPVRRAKDMEEAVGLAAGLAASMADGAGPGTGMGTGPGTAGATVLLAPACSSLDMFRDYAARGDAFAGAVLARTAGDV